jgi:Tol biopolymer transport system component
MLMRVLSAVWLIFWLTGPLDAEAGLKTVDGRTWGYVGTDVRPAPEINSSTVEEKGGDETEALTPKTTAGVQTEGKSADENAPVTSTEQAPLEETLPDPPMRGLKTNDALPPEQKRDVLIQPGTPEATDTAKQPEPDSAPGAEADAVAPPQPNPAGKSAKPAEPPLVLEPEYVQALADLSAGHNDSNPVWSPSGAMLAFERSIGDKREIVVARRDGSLVQKIYCRLADGEDEMDFLLPGIINGSSYNSGLTWSTDEKRLVFMSNGGSGNYDLYLLPAIGNEQTVRLTEHPQKDSHPHWSPMGDRLVFVSGRTGTADVFIMALASRRLVRLTNGGKTNLYPQWSPDGKKIAWIYGSNENHDIHLIADVQRPNETHHVLIQWLYDDLRPNWSPDGTRIAFYSNYNPQGDPKIWSIVVVAANGTDPTDGGGLAEKVVAKNVIPDIERGPAWMPDSRRIIYVKNDEQAYNPLYVVDIQEKREVRINTATRMNHDVVCAPDGTFAFRAQTEQWDHIYLAKLKD